MTGNELNCLLDDPVDSLLWIGTQRAGLNVYDYAHDCFYHYRHDSSDPHSLVTDDITDIAVAQNGNIWVSTYWNGVDLLDKKQENLFIIIHQQYLNWSVIKCGRFLTMAMVLYI